MAIFSLRSGDVASSFRDLMAGLNNLSRDNIQDGEIVTDKIADGAITKDKLGLPWNDWTPTYTNYGSVTTTVARYMDLGNLIILYIRAVGTAAAASPEIRFRLPIEAKDYEVFLPSGYGFATDSSHASAVPQVYAFTDSTGLDMAVRKYDRSNWPTGAETNFVIHAFYEPIDR